MSLGFSSYIEKRFTLILMKASVVKWILACTAVCMQFSMLAQPLVEEVRSPNVTGIKLYKKTDQLLYPILRLGETEGMELHFDDINNSSRSYFYTYVLCNADWTMANVSNMDYIKGFTQTRLNQFRFSSATQSKYVHYGATLPAANSMPSRAGNYVLKVYEGGDTSKLLFSKRFLVVNQRATVSARMQQPFAPEYFLTHQKILINLNLGNQDIMNPAKELKVVVMQNNRWDNARTISNPTFIRGRTFEYSDEQQLVFEAGKEWRWLDLRSFRLQSDRVASVNYNVQPYDVRIRPDTIRSPIRYAFYADINGRYAVSHIENINPWWQGDIGKVHFTFLPQNGEIPNEYNVYLFGEMTQYQLNEQTRMKWNDNMQAYETSILLKNGYYNYCYVAVPKKNPSALPSMKPTEGSIWETENDYRVLVYYTPFGSRTDELVGISELNSRVFMTGN